MAPFSYIPCYHYDFTHTFLQESIVWWTGRSALIPAYLNISYAFENSVWIILLGTIIATTISWIYILRYQNYVISKFDLVLAIYTMLIQNGYPNYNILPPRSLTLIWIFSTMILAVAFSGISFTLLTKEIFGYEILTLEEASMTSDAKFCYQLINAIYFETLPKSVAKGIEQKRYDKFSSIPPCLKLATQQEHIFGLGAIRTTEYDVPRSYSNENGEALLYSLKETWLRWDISMIMKRGYPLLRRFDLWIPRIVQSGFLDKWENDFNDNILRARRNCPKLEFDALGLEHLLIAFLILIGGMVVSLVAFFIENFKLFNRCNDCSYQ